MYLKIKYYSQDWLLLEDISNITMLKNYQRNNPTAIVKIKRGDEIRFVEIKLIKIKED